MSGTQTGYEFTYIGYGLNNRPSDAIDRPELGGIDPWSSTKTFTEHGFQRGNPENDDSYMFLTLEY